MFYKLVLTSWIGVVWLVTSRQLMFLMKKTIPPLGAQVCCIPVRVMPDITSFGR